MSFRSPLGHARGLGSARDGTHHFWVQRITAIALIPLTLWFVFSVVRLADSDYETVGYWVSYPAVAVTLVLFLATALYHSVLGLQVVIEDYTTPEGWKLIVIMLMKFAHAVIAGAAIFAVLMIALT